jgi:1,4-alpha-glucan branching enzyme
MAAVPVEFTYSTGLARDAVWYSDFCHHLVGDGKRGSQHARLLRTAGTGGDGSLAMAFMGGALIGSRERKITYAESHDEAGNGEETARTMVVAVNGAPLVGPTRRYAEARCRFAFGMAALSAGTPMFLMGEERSAPPSPSGTTISRGTRRTSPASAWAPAAGSTGSTRT